MTQKELKNLASKLPPGSRTRISIICNCSFGMVTHVLSGDRKGNTALGRAIINEAIKIVLHEEREIESQMKLLKQLK